jgi:hypothetical protein
MNGQVCDSESKEKQMDKHLASETESQRATNKMLQDTHADFLTDKNIVRLDANSAKYCPDAKDHEICKMTQQDAASYCKEQGGHLPSTREFAAAMNPKAILENDYVDTKLKGIPPVGYYKVASQDDNGKVDTFYFNNNMVARKLTGQLSKNSFWTSSIVLQKTGYAHVFYGPLGGGGGPAEEHARSFKHAVLIVKDNYK